MAIQGLDPSKIASLYANKRTKGKYVLLLSELMDSDEPGVDVAETWPLTMSGKKPTTVYQGFRNAAKTLELDIPTDLDVVQRDGSVFILVSERCQQIRAGELATA